ncbi:MAG: DNA repair protein RecO (recombination protein O) [Flavobacteriales bacterium]|jgi:DNA repair protein RecO (recombination protein O)
MTKPTTGIVIHHFNYSDSAVIARIFTLDFGYASFFVRKSKKSKTLAHLQPGTLLDMVVHIKPDRDIHAVREMKLVQPFISIHNDIRKSAQILFLSEILYRSLEIDYKNIDLFDFIWNAYQWLDQVDEYPDFHLLFLIKLSSYYGFYPQHTDLQNARYFDLEGGVFTMARPIHPMHLADPETESFRTLLGTKFDEQNELLSNATRQKLLEALVDYFKLHVSGIKEVNSRIVLETVFND